MISIYNNIELHEKNQKVPGWMIRAMPFVERFLKIF